jgi:hypothetical protein
MPQLKEAAVLGKNKKYTTQNPEYNKDVNDLLAGFLAQSKENFIKQEIGQENIIYYK